MKKIVVIFAVLLSTALFSYAFTVPDKPTGYVNDYANILSVDVKQSLENELKSFTASTSNEIAVVTIPDLGGDTVENYASKLFASWKIGNAKNDNGILLLISRDDHKLRIEVGYGLEGALPDILAKDIIDNKITPSFKQGNYDNGVIEGVKAIEYATKGEYKVSNNTQGGLDANDTRLLNFGFYSLMFGFMLLQILASIFARSKSWWAGGVVGFIGGLGIAWYLMFSLFGLVIIVAILSTIGFLLDFVVSKGYQNAKDRGVTPPWWAGGPGRSSSGGSSFGGFSGGSSGGGGASGSW